jgi:alkylation response protein AidB-like acyl-CoA dehydrogenase
MNFDFTEDQQMLMTAFESLLDGYRQPPQGVHGYVAYSAELQAEVAQAGFLEVAAQPGFGLLEAALLVEAAAACPVSAELAASMLIAPLFGERDTPRAVAWGLGRPTRYLMQARKLCLFHKGEAWIGTPEPEAVRPVESVAAYPLGILGRMPNNATRLDDATAAAVHRRALIGIAAEAAGLMRGALENTVQYVKDREQFGHPLGHFQAIQHRLAECAQLVRAARWLALRAAQADSDVEAATACLYAQDVMRKVITDCHQFSGAMGLTLEFPLHLWTYRLKFLQGEAGGRPQQAQRAAQALWPETGVVQKRIKLAV